MSKFNAFTLTIASICLVGCTGSHSGSLASKGVVKNGIFVDASNVPLCPVTGAPIASGKEVGKTVFKGTEYHFCCAGCPEEFKANPVKYAAR